MSDRYGTILLSGFAIAIGWLAAPVTAQDAVGVYLQELPIMATGEIILEVRGEGKSTAVPDRATINAGVTSTATSPREATAANARQMNALMVALRPFDIEGSNIQTSQISLRPEYARDEQGNQLPEIAGYIAVNSVALQIADLDKASAIVTALFEGGANTVAGPRFYRDDSKGTVAEARRDAIADAQAKAALYADGFGLRIDRIMKIDESGRSADPYGVAEEAVAYMSVDMAYEAPVPIERGELNYSAQVNVRYALVPR